MFYWQLFRKKLLYGNYAVQVFGFFIISFTFGRKSIGRFNRFENGEMLWGNSNRSKTQKQFAKKISRTEPNYLVSIFYKILACKIFNF